MADPWQDHPNVAAPRSLGDAVWATRDGVPRWVAKTEPQQSLRRDRLATDARIRQAPELMNPLTIPGVDLWFDANNMGSTAPAYGYDQFGRADSALALGTADSGLAWAAQNGIVGISGKQAYLPSGAGGDASITTGVSDVVLEALVTLGASGTTQVELFPRVTASNNRIRVILKFDNGANNLIQVLSVVAGAGTQISINSAAGFAYNTTYLVKVVAKGATYTVYVNGVQKTTGVDGGNNFLTSTAQGFGFGASDVLSRVSIFSVAPVDLVDGDAVSGWPELSQVATLGHGKQATSANRPTYKAAGINSLYPSVRFNGSTTSLPTSAPSTDKPVTLLAVAARSAAGVAQAILGSTNGGLELRSNASNVLELLSANTASIGAGVDTVPAAAAVIAVTYDGNGTYVPYINGRPSGISLNQRSFTAAQTAVIGANQASDFFTGDIGEIIRFNRVLEGEEMRALTQSLAAKWGITLPARVGTAGSRVPLNGLSRIRGANLSPNSQETAVNGADAWVGLWSLWNWTSLKARIDNAVALGANTIRLIGDVQVVFGGTITQAQYLANLEQLVSYLESIGVNYYHVGSDLRHTGGASTAYITSFLSAQAQQLARHQNVAAFELTNELASVYPTWPESLLVESVAQWSAAVRTAFPTVPITVSSIGALSAGQAGSNSIAAGLGDYRRFAMYDPYVDFFDFHVYPTVGAPITAQDFTPYFTISDKPVMLGEVGADRVTIGAATAAAYAPLQQLLANNPRILGANHWDISSDRFGLYNVAGVLQTDTPPIWGIFPVAPS